MKEIRLLTGLTFRCVSQHQSINKLNEYRIYKVKDIKKVLYYKMYEKQKWIEWLKERERNRA